MGKVDILKKFGHLESAVFKLSRSPHTTRKVARLLADRLKAGMVVAMTGGLGAGKTTFVQGLAEGLGVFNQNEVLSPTFTLANEYPGERLPLVHIDFYRLDNLTSAKALGLEEMIWRRDAVVAIEWAEKLPELVPTDAIWISFSAQNKNERRITLSNWPGKLRPF